MKSSTILEQAIKRFEEKPAQFLCMLLVDVSCSNGMGIETARTNTLLMRDRYMRKHRNSDVDGPNWFGPLGYEPSQNIRRNVLQAMYADTIQAND